MILVDVDAFSVETIIIRGVSKFNIPVTLFCDINNDMVL